MKEKTIGQLAKEHPDKSYRDLERYRDADRMEEAQRTPLTESRQKQEELEPIEKEIDYHRYWKDMYEKEHKLRQEAQGETTIVKGIGMNSPEMKDAQERIKELENSLSIAQFAIKKKMSVRQLEQYVNYVKNKKNIKSSSGNTKKDPNILAIEKSLSDHLGLTVTIKQKKSEQGELKVVYKNFEQLDYIIKRLNK